MAIGVKAKAVKKAVKETYGAIASGERQGCCVTDECCQELYTIASRPPHLTVSSGSAVAGEADLGLGCGDPTAYADLLPGHIVLDLGAGAGADAFRAAQRVGTSGYVIGVDMTPEMVIKARKNAVRGGFFNVEFVQAEMENLPIATNSVDRVISNCVINLCPDKMCVFSEAHRVLKPGGSLTVSDIVSLGDIPLEVRADMEAWAGCIAGTLKKEDYLGIVRSCGFQDVRIIQEAAYPCGQTEGFALASITLRAARPR